MYFKPPTSRNDPANPFYHPMNEEVKTIDKKKAKDIYDKLKKGSEIEVNFGNAFTKGGTPITLKVTSGHRVVGASRVGRIILVNKENPRGVKYKLFDRNGSVSLAQGDMGTILRDMKIIKEGVEELDEATVDTSHYRSDHGKRPNPNETGGWSFSATKFGKEFYMSPNKMPYKDAKAEAEKIAKKKGFNKIYLAASYQPDFADDNMQLDETVKIMFKGFDMEQRVFTAKLKKFGFDKQYRKMMQNFMKHAKSGDGFYFIDGGRELGFQVHPVSDMMMGPKIKKLGDKQDLGGGKTATLIAIKEDVQIDEAMAPFPMGGGGKRKPATKIGRDTRNQLEMTKPSEYSFSAPAVGGGTFAVIPIKSSRPSSQAGVLMAIFDKRGKVSAYYGTHMDTDSAKKFAKRDGLIESVNEQRFKEPKKVNYKGGTALPSTMAKGRKPVVIAVPRGYIVQTYNKKRDIFSQEGPAYKTRAEAEKAAKLLEDVQLDEGSTIEFKFSNPMKAGAFMRRIMRDKLASEVDRYDGDRSPEEIVQVIMHPNDYEKNDIERLAKQYKGQLREDIEEGQMNEEKKFKARIAFMGQPKDNARDMRAAARMGMYDAATERNVPSKRKSTVFDITFKSERQFSQFMGAYDVEFLDRLDEATKKQNGEKAREVLTSAKVPHSMVMGTIRVPERFVRIAKEKLDDAFGGMFQKKTGFKVSGTMKESRDDFDYLDIEAAMQDAKLEAPKVVKTRRGYQVMVFSRKLKKHIPQGPPHRSKAAAEKDAKMFEDVQLGEERGTKIKVVVKGDENVYERMTRALMYARLPGYEGATFNKRKGMTTYAFDAKKHTSAVRKMFAKIIKTHNGEFVQSIEEGFASDAQRRAAFASGYKAKGKKKNEEEEVKEGLRQAMSAPRETPAQKRKRQEKDNFDLYKKRQKRIAALRGDPSSRKLTPKQQRDYLRRVNLDQIRAMEEVEVNEEKGTYSSMSRRGIDKPLLAYIAALEDELKKIGMKYSDKKVDPEMVMKAYNANKSPKEAAKMFKK